MISGHASPSAIYISTVCLTAVASIFVTLRLITRLAIVRWSGLDDVCISIATIFNILLGVSIIEQVRLGVGRHILELPQILLLEGFKWFWAFIWLYYCTLMFTKLSILLQYLRIFSYASLVKPCWVLVAMITIWGLFATLTGIINCIPVERFWLEPIKHPPGCLDRVALWYANAAVNIVTDVATALLPLPLINSLNIPQRQKIIVMAVFAVGLVTCLMSVLRLVWLTPLTTSIDATWESALPTIWSSVEVNTAIICSCVPTLKGLVQQYFPRLLGSSLRSDPGGRNHDQQQPASRHLRQIREPVELKTLSSSQPSSNRSRRFYTFGRHPSVREMITSFDRTSAAYNSHEEDEEGIVASASTPGHSLPVGEEEIIRIRTDFNFSQQGQSRKDSGEWPAQDVSTQRARNTVAWEPASLPPAWNQSSPLGLGERSHGNRDR